MVVTDFLCDICERVVPLPAMPHLRACGSLDGSENEVRCDYCAGQGHRESNCDIKAYIEEDQT